MGTAQDVPISREAGDKTKGFRFQKLRAAIRLLERIEINPQAQVYCALEFLEDSAMFSGDEPVSVEENKQYASGLSLNSAPVKNSLVAFFDTDAAFNYSKGLRFGFYASAEIADERLPREVVSRISSASTPTSFQLLRKLAQGIALSDEEVTIAKHIIEQEYIAQYSARDGGEARKPPFASWNAAAFRSFLEKIEWEFTTQGNEELEERALQLVRNCPFFDHRHEGLELFLVCAITDLLEKRSHAKGAVERIVGTADVKILFLQILAQCREDKLDPAHLEWDNEIVNDVRNLSDKVLAVAPDYPNSQLMRHARRIALAKHDQDSFGREYVSLRLRVLHACQDELQRLETALSRTMTQAEIDTCIDNLVKASVTRMNSLSATWTYRVANEEAIRGAVLSLFDDCYLAFDDATA